MFGMGAVYAVKVGMNVNETVVFMSLFIVMGALAQWPMGWLSDQFDRRLVVALASLVAALSCLVLINIESVDWLFYAVYSLLGAMSLPIYSIGVAHTNDRLKPEQMSSASSTLVLIMGIGSVMGPLSAGYVLSKIGASGYLMHIGIAHLTISLLMVYFMFQREAVAEEDQTLYQTLPARPTVVAMEAFAQEAEDSMDA